MKKIVSQYKDLWKENRLKKKTVTTGEKVYMIVGIVVLSISVYGVYRCDKSANPSINMLLLSMMGVLVSAFLTMYKLNVISSKVFYREDLRPDDWFDKLDSMLRDCNIVTNEEIDYLREWCTDVLNEKTAAKVFAESLEKILGIFIIPTIITVLSIYLDKAESWILFYKSILAVVAMLWIGLVVYIVLPLITGKNDDRDVIKYLSRDLIELQIYKEKDERNEPGQNEMGSTVGTSEE